MKTLHRRCATAQEGGGRLPSASNPRDGDLRGAPISDDDPRSAGACGLAGTRVHPCGDGGNGHLLKPIWHTLEGRFQQILANAAHINGVPGRKSDTNDAAWIADLLAHSLIPGSFVPPQPIQELRDLTRTRKQLYARDRAAHSAQSALVVARISAGCCVSVLPATAAPIHAAVTGASSFCNGVLRNRQLLLGGAPAHTSRSTDHWSAHAWEWLAWPRQLAIHR